MEGEPSPAVRGVRIVRRLEALSPNSLHQRARIGVGAATFFDAFDGFAIASVLPVLVGLWGLSPQQIGFVISATFVGQLVGTFLFSWIAERFGRLRSVTLSMILFGVMSIACALSPNIYWLIAFRMVQGVGLGGELPVAAAYINEIVQAKSRGRFVVLYETLFPLGLLVSTIVGSLTVPHWGWQSMFYLSAVPAVGALLLRAVLPESPRWLVSRGRLDEAERAVEKFEAAAKLPIEPQAVEDDADILEPADAPKVGVKGRWSDIFSPSNRRQTFVVWAVWIAGGSLTTVLTVWFPTLYTSVFKTTLQEALRFAILTTFGGLIGSVACAILIDKLGRRRWMTFAFGACGALCLAGAAYMSTGVQPPAIVIAGFVAMAYALVSGAFITAYAYTPEVYPTALRAYGAGTASATLRIASAVTPIAVGLILPVYGITGIIAGLSVIAIGAALIVWLFAIETKGRVLEEIAH